MKIIATLACRSNSSRLYGKPLQLLQTRSILDFIIDRLKERKEISQIVLAISETRGNEAFFETAKAHNIPFVLGDDRDVLGRLVKACEFAGGDTVYRATTEDPYSYLEGLSWAVVSHAKKKADHTTYEGLPVGCSYELISLRALQISHKSGSDRHRSELCALYINEHKNKFKFNILDIPKTLRRSSYRLTVDYPEDLIVVRKIAYHFSDKKYIPYKKLIAFLDRRPELTELVTDLEKKNKLNHKTG